MFALILKINIFQIYYKPLSKNGLLPEPTLEKIFGNIKSVVNVNNVLLKQLEAYYGKHDSFIIYLFQRRIDERRKGKSILG